MGDYALCLEYNSTGLLDGSSTLGLILASMTQTHGPSTGFLFDPNDMTSFVDSQVRRRGGVGDERAAAPS